MGIKNELLRNIRINQGLSLGAMAKFCCLSQEELYIVESTECRIPERALMCIYRIFA